MSENLKDGSRKPKGPPTATASSANHLMLLRKAMDYWGVKDPGNKIGRKR